MLQCALQGMTADRDISMKEVKIAFSTRLETLESMTLSIQDSLTIHLLTNLFLNYYHHNPIIHHQILI